MPLYTYVCMFKNTEFEETKKNLIQYLCVCLYGGVKKWLIKIFSGYRFSTVVSV